MKSRCITLTLGGLLALTSFVATPAMADDFNKRTEFQFSGPVQIPGKVLAPGKYVFQLADSQSDRNIVQVFSEDSKGNQSFVTTILAIPEYIENTPDKPIVHFEERHSGAPEAIHSWFYPGDNTGWAFVYPNVETSDVSAGATPAPAAVASADAGSLLRADLAQEEATASEVPEVAEVAAVEGDVSVAQDASPAPLPEQDTDTQKGVESVLPETGGYSALAFLTGLALLGSGGLMVFAARCKSRA